jgi:hypothetical protein
MPIEAPVGGSKGKGWPMAFDLVVLAVLASLLAAEVGWIGWA